MPHWMAHAAQNTIRQVHWIHFMGPKTVRGGECHFVGSFRQAQEQVYREWSCFTGIMPGSSLPISMLKSSQMTRTLQNTTEASAHSLDKVPATAYAMRVSCNCTVHAWDHFWQVLRCWPHVTWQSSSRGVAWVRGNLYSGQTLDINPPVLYSFSSQVQWLEWIEPTLISIVQDKECTVDPHLFGILSYLYQWWILLASRPTDM